MSYEKVTSLFLPRITELEQRVTNLETKPSKKAVKTLGGKEIKREE